MTRTDENTWNLSSREEDLRALERGAAVLVVHNLGNVVNVPRLKRLRPDLVFVEDNCEGIFGKYEGVSSGCSEASLCASLSFFANKSITAGEGGAFLTNDTALSCSNVRRRRRARSEKQASLARRRRALYLEGRRKGRGWFA